MSRNATALKPSLTRRPVRRLRSVELPEDFEPDVPRFTSRVQILKDMALTLLTEAQSLENETLMSELAMPEGIRQTDIERGINLDETVRRFESNIIRQALLITGGNQARAARLLGVKPNTLNYKVKLYNF
ncbi:MAG TPA: helix-turn-helix domain-containing protein [Pyrinomonadaceae bacterium]|nr:helix-turn-helix domain-containing protein [Pyrinomonadaceae bacterium]